jgi:menaquinone-specific isochorismate synthase
MLPRCLLVSTHDEKWLVINRVVLEGSDAKISYSEFEDEFEQFEQSVIASLETVPNETSDSFQIELLTSQQEWINAVNAVKWEIQGGGLEKVVLARAKRLYFAGEVDPFIALNELSKQYPDCTKFLFSFSPGSAFLGATPEYLAAVQDGALRTMALAGSIRRGGTPEEDKRLGQQLMGSAKDQREHDFVVNFLRETLGPLANGLAISQEPQLHELQNIQHLRTDVQASLRDGVDILDVVAALHPTPALGGLPRQRALEMIAELETESRGWYGAPVGWLDGHGNGEFVVGIRSGVVQGNQACIYAGAGIVADSDPIGEWHETELKFEPMGKAFTGSV